MASRQSGLERLRAETSAWRSAILLTAAELDLFAWMGKSARSPSAVAAHFGGDPEAWEIFLNALCAMGRLGKRGHQYSNRLRREATPVPPRRDDMWSGLAAALRTGTRPKTQRPFFSDANEAYRLLSALDVDARAIAPHLIARLPIEYAGTLLDIGGGLGTFAIAFCRRYPRLRATVLEHPRIAPLARRAVAASGLGTRIRVTGVDFTRRTLPRGFDTVFVSNVLHAHGAEENRSLVGKIRRCLNPGGRLIVRDVLVSRDGTRPEWAALFSVSLLLNSPRGRCYTLDDIAGWLRRSGFSRIQGPFRSSPLAFDPDSVLVAEM